MWATFANMVWEPVDQQVMEGDPSEHSSKGASRRCYCLNGVWKDLVHVWFWLTTEMNGFHQDFTGKQGSRDGTFDGIIRLLFSKNGLFASWMKASIRYSPSVRGCFILTSRMISAIDVTRIRRSIFSLERVHSSVAKLEIEHSVCLALYSRDSKPCLNDLLWLGHRFLNDV